MTTSWEVLYQLGAVILLTALIGGVVQYVERNRASRKHPKPHSQRHDGMKPF